MGIPSSLRAPFSQERLEPVITPSHRGKHVYRADIDGLRAVAVLSVMLFHLRTPGFGGGFVGVDVFFVISGYLMAAIIFDGLKAGSFTLAGFYERRIRRIFPALYAVVAACTIVSLAIFLPIHLRVFGQSLAAISVFASNFLFWLSLGYFDGQSAQIPLLHTWSLAVEEQFYIIFPLLLMLLRRRSSRSVARILLCVAIASFGFTVWSTQAYPRVAFFSLPSRAWELLLGSTIALGFARSKPTRFAGEAAALCGLALILFSVVAYSRYSWFPGFAAAAPCAGAALIIFAGKNSQPAANRLLSCPPLRWTGRISYSLYLWHWPLIAFIPYYLDRSLKPTERGLVFVASFILAVLSFRFVEQPFRGPRSRYGRADIFRGAALVTASAALAGVLLYLSHGLPIRVKPEVTRLDSFRTGQDHSLDSCTAPDRAADNPCRVGTPGVSPSILLWGDSHAQMIGRVVGELATTRGLAVAVALQLNCPPLQGVWRTDTNAPAYCGPRERSQFNDTLIQYVREHPEISTVVIAARWGMWAEGSAYGEEEGDFELLADAQSKQITPAHQWEVFDRGLRRTVENLASMKKRVVLVADAPEIGRGVSASLAKQMMYRRPQEIRPALADYMTRQRRVLEDFEGLKKAFGGGVVYPSAVLCRTGMCSVVENGNPLYSDSNHLTVAGAMAIKPALTPIFNP